MTTLFLQILDQSKVASLVILAVLLARFCLKKAPKIVSYALWAVVLFRLLCPLSVQTPVSIVPELAPTARNYSLAGEPVSLADAGAAAYQAVGDALNGGLGIQQIRATERDGSVRVVTADWGDVWILFGQYVWAAGLGAMLLHGALSYGKLRRGLRTAVPLRGNVYLADGIPSPFVIGLRRPRIYLPGGLDETERRYILCHEQHHIERHDPLYKLLGYLALCLHWFNPLVWLAFVLAEKDMEMSCDEAVVRQLGAGIRAGYAASLLAFATGRRRVAGTPLAFGEGSAKARIKNLANWRRPVRWGAVAAVLLAVCLVTDPIITPRSFSGVVTGVTETALILEADGKEIGLLLTDETLVAGPLAREEIGPGALLSADCARRKKTLVTPDGARLPAYEVRTLWATGQLHREAAVLADGTRLDVREEYGFYHTYSLPDGTELLRVNEPYGPEQIAGFDALSETAQARIRGYYEARGLLYDEKAALETVYALYRELGEDFSPSLVEQNLSLTATGDGAVYFLTTVTLPAGQENGNVVQESRLCDAFDRQTGEPIDTWDLFTVPKETVMRTLLDECGLLDEAQRAAMQALPWDGRILFFPDSLSVMFAPGELPNMDYGGGFGVDLTPTARALLQDWAVPKQPS